MTDTELLTDKEILIVLDYKPDSLDGWWLAPDGYTRPQSKLKSVIKPRRAIARAQRQKMVDEGWLNEQQVKKLEDARDEAYAEGKRDGLTFVADARADERKTCLSDLRVKVAIEYGKCVREAEADPFETELLNHEHMILWRGHANAYSEVMGEIDALLKGETVQ